MISIKTWFIIAFVAVAYASVTDPVEAVEPQGLCEEGDFTDYCLEAKRLEA